MGLEQKSLRIAGSVLAGVLLWTVLWFAFTTAAKVTFPETLVDGQPLQAPQFLVMYIGASALLSPWFARTAAGVEVKRPAAQGIREA